MILDFPAKYGQPAQNRVALWRVIMSTGKARVAVTAAAMFTVGLLASPAPAQAVPCKQWAFAGYTVLRQSNGWELIFNSRDTRATGIANARAKGGAMRGNITGGIDGYAVNLQVAWNGGEFGEYRGSVNVNGFASGHTVDATNPGSSAGWQSVDPLRCVQQ
jgi:hypothetical protein